MLDLRLYSLTLSQRLVILPQAATYSGKNRNSRKIEQKLTGFPYKSTYLHLEQEYLATDLSNDEEEGIVACQGGRHGDVPTV